MTRWLRILVLTILLPAYGIAAAGVTSFVSGLTQAEHLLVDGHPVTPSLAKSATPASTTPSDDGRPGVTLPDADADGIASLLHELGDTSDDMPDHCKPDAEPVRLTQAQLIPLATPEPHAPDIWPQPPRRPPRA
ncbi:hypothetical protein [Roseateles sp.]|uniref:hypothetical protein n=1 Tax=Roseateles sp. TaxID=1971397 RepID=UPI0031E1B136